MSFIRYKQVDVLNYLPKFLKSEKSFLALNNTLSEEHELMRLHLVDLLNQLSVDTATWALDRWEDFVGVAHDITDTYKRRERIKMILNRNNVSNETFMINMANQYIVDKSCFFVENYKQYAFDLYFNRDKCYNIVDLTRMVELYKPAHLGYTLHEVETTSTQFTPYALCGISEVIELRDIEVYESPTTEFTIQLVSNTTTEGTLVLQERRLS